MQALILGLVAATATSLGLWQSYLRWHAHGVEPTRAAAKEMREAFGSVLDFGGLDTNQFITKERRDLATAMNDLLPTLHDSRLRAALADIGAAWNEVVTCAPSPPPPPSPARYESLGPGLGPLIPYSIVNTSTGLSRDQSMVIRQTAAARDGQKAVQRVLDRCNTLTRWVIG